MEMATMSKVMGRFLLALFAGLVPATQPFHSKTERAAALLPTGVYAQGTNAPNGGNAGNGDSLTIERGAKGGYRVVCASWDERPTEFDAELFEAGKDGEGRPVRFLDLRPRAARPEAQGLPAGATHLAARVDWAVEGERVWLRFDAVDKAWLETQKPSAGMTTPELRALLRRAIAAGAFRPSVELFRERRH